jgi:hypothetical protein
MPAPQLYACATAPATVLLERLESYNTVIRFALEKPESKVLTRRFVCNVSLVLTLLIVLPAVLVIVVEWTDADDSFYNSTSTLPHISTNKQPVYDISRLAAVLDV